MKQAVVLNGMTSTRTRVISNRTKCWELGIIKALMIDNLKAKMSNGVAHFIYEKRNGELREAWGTTQQNIARAKTTGTGVSREYYATTAYYDVEQGAWRSFRWESLVSVF